MAGAILKDRRRMPAVSARRPALRQKTPTRRWPDNRQTNESPAVDSWRQWATSSACACAHSDTRCLSAAPISKFSDALARRRSGVRTPCGPPPRLCSEAGFARPRRSKTFRHGLVQTPCKRAPVGESDRGLLDISENGEMLIVLKPKASRMAKHLEESELRPLLSQAVVTWAQRRVVRVRRWRRGSVAEACKADKPPKRLLDSRLTVENLQDDAG